MHMRTIVSKNGQSVDCYGDWDEDSNAAVVFEDENFDGIYADGAETWQQAVDMVTEYAERVGTTVIEMSSC